jgi:protein O-mannosyl-transferase
MILFPKSSKRLDVLVPCLALAILVTLVYGQIARNGFIAFDDDRYVYDNPVVRQGITLEGVEWAFTTFHTGNWHPLAWMSHMVDVELFGMDAGAHHLVSVALHAANAVLLFLVLYRMTGSRCRSFIVASLFALHPLHVESVAWIAERKDLLCAFFFLLTILAYARYASQPGIRVWLPVPILFLFALLSKPMAVTLPFVLLLLDYWPLERIGRNGAPLSLRGALLEKLPLFLMSAASCAVTYIAQEQGGSITSSWVLPLSDRLGYATISCLVYLRRMIWPLGLSIYYPHPAVVQVVIPAWVKAGAATVVVAGSVFVYLRRRLSPFLTVGWFWYLGMLVPVIGIVQVGRQLTADRYTYLPLVGIYIAVTWSLANVFDPPRFRIPRLLLCLGLLGGLATLSWNQASRWRDSKSIFRRSLESTPNASLLRTNLAIVLKNEGKLDEAIEQYEAAIRSSPDDSNARYNFAVALNGMGRFDEAMSQYREAIRVRPDDAFARSNLGVLLMRKGMKEEALSQFREAVRLDPSDEVARMALKELGAQGIR